MKLVAKLLLACFVDAAFTVSPVPGVPVQGVPPDAGPESCEKWCNPRTCDKAKCAGCPLEMCPSPTSTCHEWCNAYTCFDERCTGCTVCEAGKPECEKWCLPPFTCGGSSNALSKWLHSKCSGCEACEDQCPSQTVFFLAIDPTPLIPAELLGPEIAPLQGLMMAGASLEIHHTREVADCTDGGLAPCDTGKGSGVVSTITLPTSKAGGAFVSEFIELPCSDYHSGDSYSVVASPLGPVQQAVVNLAPQLGPVWYMLRASDAAEANGILQSATLAYIAGDLAAYEGFILQAEALALNNCAFPFKSYNPVIVDWDGVHKGPLGGYPKKAIGKAGDLGKAGDHPHRQLAEEDKCAFRLPVPPKK